MKDIHPKQKELVQLLLDNPGEPKTLRQLAEALGISSTSVVHHHITQLEKKGLLKRDPNNPSNYQVFSEPEKQVAYLNLYGLAQCGPDGSILEGNPEARIPVPTTLLGYPASQAFLVRAKGDSMTPKINEGDLVIARRTFEMTHGQIVVCVDDGVAKIKKLIVPSGEKPKIQLQSLNSDYETTEAKPDFRVEGRVTGILFRGL